MSEHGSGSFSTTTEVNPSEQRKEITTRRGTMVGLKDGSEFCEKKTKEPEKEKMEYKHKKCLGN